MSHSKWKEALIQITSGGSAGFVEISIMHPLDLVKTRLQLQSIPPRDVSFHDTKHYRGIVDCLQKMYKTEGVFSYWKGILPPIFAETPKRAIKFFSFEQYKQFFMFGSPVATPLTFALSGLAAGLTEGLFVNPFEVVKVTLQANKKAGLKEARTWETTKLIIRDQGFGMQGLNKGLTATLGRNGVYNCFYLGFYHSMKGILPTPEDPYKDFARKVFIGFLSGTGASILNIPFDVAKSRIQGPQPELNTIKYSGTIKTIGIVYKEEGFFALYKGLLAKVLRLGPGGAIMLVIYDYSFEYLSAKFL